jgi:leucine-rich repeat protein SHOC2
MRSWVIAIAVSLSCAAQAQLLRAPELDSARTYRNLQRALAQPELVYRLDLSGQKLKEVPEEVRLLVNLNALDLAHNKLKELPVWLGELRYMQEFRASRNKLEDFPAAICAFTHLKRLDLHRNRLTALPPCLGELKELMAMDLWSNDLGEFPEELAGMRGLRFMDLRAIQYNQEEIDHIRQLLPWAKINFSAPCNCGY